MRSGPDWSPELTVWTVRPSDTPSRHASAGWCRIASTSMNSWIVSPITTPPSMGMLVVMSKSLRSISPVAENPARVPP